MTASPAEGPGTSCDRAAIEAFLAEPASYGLDGAAVERIDTHVATVFLAGARAYKLKRPVAYSFLDFTTLEARRAALCRELELNRRTAPELYLAVVPLLLDETGTLCFGEAEAERQEEAGQQQAVEWVLVMRRFDQEDRFDRLAESGGLDRPLVERLVDGVMAFHQFAERLGKPFGGAAYLRRVVAENVADCADLGEILPAERIARYSAAAAEAVAEVAAILDSRRAGGLVRRCHGDLHLANIVLWRGEPTLFDCIEFSEEIANVDLLYDFAFLLMDLDVRGLRDLASAACARY
ncbi:MAG: phosphotransferase, partial [Tistlia sp.]